MAKLFLIIFLSLFSLFGFSVNCLAGSAPIYAEFIGGLNINDIKTCAIKMQDVCSEMLQKILQEKNTGDKENPMFAYAACVREGIQGDKICTQNLALLNKLKPNFVEVTNIQHYQLFDAVETKINKDIKQKWYFIVNNYGEFIDTSNIHADMQNSTTYPYFIRKYPNAALGDVQQNFPPRFENLPLGDMRLVFSRSIVNKIDNCKTCDVIATMEDAYDFKPDGELRWVKFLKLIPNGPL
jgi:hypothetical protein